MARERVVIDLGGDPPETPKGKEPAKPKPVEERRERFSRAEETRANEEAARVAEELAREQAATELRAQRETRLAELRDKRRKSGKLSDAERHEAVELLLDDHLSV